MNKKDKDKDMINPDTIPSSAIAIQRLAQKEFAKKTKSEKSETANYKTGSPSDKVWDNYQISKELKREFKELCKSKKIIASKYLRACVRLLIKKEGDVSKALKAVEKIDASKLEN